MFQSAPAQQQAAGDIFHSNPTHPACLHHTGAVNENPGKAATFLKEDIPIQGNLNSAGLSPGTQLYRPV